MEDFFAENCENDRNNQSEYSESDLCSASCSTCYSDYGPWMEYVKNDGSLFYVKNDTNLDNVSEESFSEFFSSEQSQSQKPKSKFNPAKKFKMWLAAKKLKGWRKSVPTAGSNDNKTEHKYFHVTAEFSHALIKDIFVEVDPIKVVSRSTSKTSLAEMLFGLKLGSLKENYSSNEKPRILAIRRPEEMPDIRIGDKLLSVNDIDVTMTNLDDVLKSVPIPSKVKLEITLSKSQPSSQSLFQSPKHYDLKSELPALFCNELSDESSIIEHVKSDYQHMPHCLFFLSISNGMLENEDVIYRYPDDDTSLFQLKGMFLTLGHMISDVASSPLLSCTIKVLNEIVHVGFVTEDDNIMVLALPASAASEPEIQHFSTRLANFLKYLFSSLQKAFTVGKSEGFLDKIFTLYFEHYLSPVNFSQSTAPEPHLTDILPSAHWLPLPPDLKTEMDDILSELESADFGIESEGFKENRRLYNIFGSCLFHKGYLLCSHLPKSDLLDIHLFLHSNHLLELTHNQSVAEIIIWREVFPSKYQENNDSEFKEFHGRWFLLTIVMQHSILALLLDDNECNVKCKKNSSPPEPFYVEEVQNTLWILHHYGIIGAVEKLLHFAVFPAVSPNLRYEDHSGNSLASLYGSSNSISSSGPNVSDHSNLTEKNQAHADGESGSESSYSNELSSMQNRYKSLSISAGHLPKPEIKNEQGEYGAEGDESGQNFSTPPNLHKNSFDSSDDMGFGDSFKMMSNFGDNLFYYLHMDPVEGVFIAPIIPNSSLPQSLQKSILNNFYKCCLQMRTVFERSMRNGEITKANITPKYGVNSLLQHVYEQGLLFKHNETDVTKQKSSQSSMHFWVIGRLFFSPEPREVYVCHHDGAAQDIIEMAFRLGFGLSF